MITPEMKNKVLFAIIDKNMTEIDLFYEEAFSDNEISVKNFFLIIDQFEELGLISKTFDPHRNCSTIFLKANIYDFYRRGGFTAQEELLHDNLTQLDRELNILIEENYFHNNEKLHAIKKLITSITDTIKLFKLQ